MKRIIFILLFFYNMNVKAKDTIYYVFDPMCGWCYGFSHVIQEAAKAYENDFEFVVISGGMVVGEREGPIGDFADYILGVYKRLEETTGVKVGEPYLQKLRDKSLYSSSVVPSIAMKVFEEFKPNKMVEFAGAIQKAMFVDGLDLRSDEVYKKLVQPYGIDTTVFLNKLHSDEYRKKAFDGFKQSAQLGVQGFPAVLAQKNGKYYRISNGFVDKKQLFATLTKLKEM